MKYNYGMTACKTTVVDEHTYIKIYLTAAVHNGNRRIASAMLMCSQSLLHENKTKQKSSDFFAFDFID